MRERTLDDQFPEWVEQEGPIPDLPPELLVVQAADATLGRDGNGKPLLTEIEAFFRRYRIDDEDEREVWEVMFAAMAGERAMALDERMNREGEDKG